MSANHHHLHLFRLSSATHNNNLSLPPTSHSPKPRRNISMAEGNLGGGGRSIGSVKAAINKYGQRATRTVSPQLDLPEAKSSVAEDLHKSGRELGMYRESRIASDSAKAKAEAELNKAKKKVQELTLLIEESNLRLKSRKTEAVKKLKIDGNGSNYAQITRELEGVKQELSKLKLDIAYVLKERVAAEKEVIELRVKTEENLKFVESLTLEVDAANEEHVLVELAKMEALKECKEVEEERERERKEAFESLEKMRKRTKEMKKEIKRAKGYENVLAETLADIEMLETQLKLVKDMERNVPKKQRGKDALTVLKEVTEATEAKKEELASLNAELLYLGDVMDALRKELEEVKREAARFDKIIEKDDAMIERLNAKLLIGKGRLEAVSADEERISSLADNLTCSLEKLKNDEEAAKKEEVSLKEEARIIKKTETGFGGEEKELLSKLEELEKAKQAESLALEKLESIVERTIETREMDSRSSSTITISRFEYEYLSGQARHAEETAEKKVEAAMAWVEALKASTKEIEMKTETLERESGKTMVEEERASFRMQRSLSIKRLVQNEIEKFKEESAEDKSSSSLVVSPKPVRRSVRISGKFTPVQGGKTRRYSSGNRGTPSYFVMKKKKKKVPNLVKFFSRKRDKSSLEQ
ncbi:Protein PLASTID MOVEMENT IMPAIRED 2 [Raphanus sativus]|uniref:Protein PLASTID MOVEMENT IMPAIRED 2 n=1 Tax=Raphanus sativus TaxID=3726 RepID=A0A6J0K9Y3_RAPSA|nr:protein PLASTID MOVEMENT IMPAIRED 2 [Raphanus sativus]KAJ4867156.1 Protein PLASTID MOVEMENT IMPAIRED 2 [Raphanus sativus]